MRSAAFHPCLLLLLLALVAACADPGDDNSPHRGAEAKYQEPRFPIKYDVSLLRPEHAPIFVEAADAWNEAVGLDVFIEDIGGFQPRYEDELHGAVAHGGYVYGVAFLSTYSFLLYCQREDYHLLIRSFLETATHELGHVIGLGHSHERDSVMWPLQFTCETPSKNDADRARMLIKNSSS